MLLHRPHQAGIQLLLSFQGLVEGSVLLMQRQQVGQSLDGVVGHKNRWLRSSAQGGKLSTVRSALESLHLADSLHQSWFALSGEGQEVSPQSQSQRCDRFDCPLSDQAAGGEPTQRTTRIQRVDEQKHGYLRIGCNVSYRTVVKGLPTAMISSLVERVAVRDSILAACPSFRPSNSRSDDSSSVKDICMPEKKPQHTDTRCSDDESSATD